MYLWNIYYFKNHFNHTYSYINEYFLQICWHYKYAISVEVEQLSRYHFIFLFVFSNSVQKKSRLQYNAVMHFLIRNLYSFVEFSQFQGKILTKFWYTFIRPISDLFLLFQKCVVLIRNCMISFFYKKIEISIIKTKL